MDLHLCQAYDGIAMEIRRALPAQNRNWRQAQVVQLHLCTVHAVRCPIATSRGMICTHHHSVAPQTSPPSGTGLSRRPSKLRACRSAALWPSIKVPAAAIPLREAFMHICTAACMLAVCGHPPAVSSH